MTEGNWSIALRRFGYGGKPSERRSGSPKSWLMHQINNYNASPETLRHLPGTDHIAQQFGEYRQLRNGDQGARRAARQALRRHVQNAIDARIVTAIQTQDHFSERLVHFWANHFAVSTEKQGAGPLAGSFELEAIRPHIFGKFSNMLSAAETHPAMLLYLDQAQSIGPNSLRGLRAAQRGRRRAGLNENLAREILELHTLGVRSGYTQKDVTEFAKALTGHTVPAVRGNQTNRQNRNGDAAYIFEEALHEPGAKTVLGKRYGPNGARETAQILDDLANNPATARHVATKLARHFTSDDPPPALVSRLENDFISSGGDLKSLTLALVDSPEVWIEQRNKFLTPWEWSIASARAIQPSVLEPRQIRRMMINLGQELWQPGSPAGFDDAASRWAAPESLHLRVEAAQTLGQRGARHDARTLGPELYSGIWSEHSALAVARAESPAQAMALLLASPEAMWR